MRIASKCADHCGEIAACAASSSSVRSVEVSEKNTAATRPSSCPARSIASTVFANVAGSGFAAIAAISRRCRANPSANAAT